MKLATAKAMVKRLNERFGEEVAKLRPDYSGRYMFGLTTTGVVIKAGFVPQRINNHRIDHMGLDYILY